MNDLDFLEIVENFRKGLLFLFNSSYFWIFSFFFISFGMVRHISSPFSYYSESAKKPLKSWCYDENEI